MEESETENGEKKLDENAIKKKTNEDKPKFDNKNAEQELLGSVTTVNNPGLRTSARVIQKMKQDSIRSTTPPPPEKKDAGNEKGLHRTPSQAKPPKVIWSNFEKNLFFDALNEFGKDFEAIANFINSKIKRKTAADQSFKTKEQIRQIYYQTFHKLSKYLKFSDDVKKPAQELYALINYGEMRRKLAFVSDKNCMKIKDLVYKGHVTVRSKGKNIRIKTPPCKALRKLNQLDDWQEDINLPAKIEVYLKPKSMDAWARVQNIAQNPLVQTTVPLQKKLSNFIKTFQHKWRNEEMKLALQAFNVGKNSQNAKQEVKSGEADSCLYQEPLLCICPPSDAVIHRPLISITEFLSSFSICLNAYEQKIGVKVRGETLCNKRQRSDSGCEKKSPDTKKTKSETEAKSTEGNNNGDLNAIATDGEERDELKEHKLDFNDVSNSNQSNPDDLKDLFNEALAYKGERCDNHDVETAKKHELIINSSDNAVSGFMTPVMKADEVVVEMPSKCPSEVKPRKKDMRCAASKKKETKNITNLKPLLDEDAEKKIRKGWTIQNASDISVGDLYITFGHDSKITFEYFWIKKDVEKNVKKERSSMPYNVNNVDEDSLKAAKSSNISNKLRHLLLIASLTERVKRKPCSCGHVCEKGLKNKKGEEPVSKTYVSNKTYTTSNNDCVFRQPAAPYRRQNLPLENFRYIPNGMRYNHARLLMKSRSLASKQVVVQRLLPVQPGMNQSYDVVTPQVHVRTILEKPSAPSPEWSNGNDHEAETNGIRNNGVGGRGEQNKISVNNTENNLDDSSKPDGPLQEVNITEPKSKERPFMTLGKKVDSVATAENVSSNEAIDSADTISIASSSAKEDIFSSNSSSSSDTETNDLPRIMSISEDPGIQQLMEISLPSPARTHCLEDSDTCSIPPMSPMRLIRDSPSDPKWLEENLNDFSLSSFLGHLDEMNRDLDSMSVISESSQDYMTKFAEIAASMQQEDKDL